MDEADHMFDMGFLPSIHRIIGALPAKRQTLLFSATMPDEIRRLATEMLHHPMTVEIGITEPVQTIRHAIYPVEQLQKVETLLHLLHHSGNGQVLVFTHTNTAPKSFPFNWSMRVFLLLHCKEIFPNLSGRQP